MPPQADLEDRVERIEALIDKAVAYARRSAAGRMVLRALGLS